MLTSAGSLRKVRNVRAPRAEQTAQEEADADAYASEEYGVYQGHLANMLMMSTLLFGFCATGTFLSVSFTGDETPMSTEYFIRCLENSLQSTVASVGVTMLVFVFSARAALQYQLFGAQAALQPIYKGTLFITLAEVLLYYSLISFVSSINNYASMNYVGPNICPRSPSGEISNTSFCSRVGDSIYQEAQNQLCGTADAQGLYSGRFANSRTQGLTPQGPWILCRVFDDYTYDQKFPDGLSSDQVGQPVVEAPLLTWWFGWDTQRNWVDVDLFTGGTGNGIFTEGNADLYHFWIQEAFLDVVTRTSDSMCGKNVADDEVTAHCTTTPNPALCLQARSLLLQADACSGGKEDDAVKCRKACQAQWISDDEWDSTKNIVRSKMQFYVRLITYGLWITLIGRAIAGLITTIKSLCNYARQDSTGACGLLWVFDCFGIFDTFQSGLTLRTMFGGSTEEDEDDM